MFGFLAPTALLGLGLLSIPILLHIFKPRKVKRTPFSSLRWLRASQHRLSRRIKWHQVFLFLLRAAFVALLVFAIAKPVLSPGGGKGVAERFVIVDVGRTMNYRMAEGPSPIERARHLAEQALLQAVPGDRSAVLLAGSQTESLGPLAEDPMLYLAKLRTVQAGLTDADLTATLRVIPPMIGTHRPDSNVELYFLTDHRATKWRQGDIAAFEQKIGQPVRVRVIDVGADMMRNAWVSSARFIETDNGRRRTIRVQVGAAGDETTDRTVRLSRLPGLPEQTAAIKARPGQITQAEFQLPPDYDLRDKIGQVTIEPADRLPSDDTAWVDLDARGATRVLLIEPPSTQIEELQPGYHLRAALDALADAQGGGLRVTRRPDRSVSADDVNAADVIFLAEARSMSDGTVQAIERRVQAGAGVAIFLGPSVDRDFYNSRLYNPLRPTASLLSVRLKDPVNRRADASLPRLGDVKWNHPIMSRLFDPTLGDMAQVSFSGYYRLEEMAGGGGGEVLATIGGQEPAIIDRELGEGRVVLFNTSPNDAWSDLPRRKSYVPLVDQLLAHLSGGLNRRVLEAGGAVALPLPDANPDTKITLTTPGGQSLDARPRTVGGRVVMQVENAAEAGVYSVEYQTPQGPRTFRFVVQVGGHDATLARADDQALTSWWAPSKFETIKPGGDKDALDLGGGRTLLEPWVVAAACLFLMAEMFFVHWLCPRMNPNVMSASLLSRRGSMLNTVGATTAGPAR
ncbi:MAG: BatA domain-containing protein [Planctomycetes bacterium]|nr:BatA domain-containing protein [Planctomycetota bacterium]